MGHFRETVSWWSDKARSKQHVKSSNEKRQMEDCFWLNVHERKEIEEGEKADIFCKAKAEDIWCDIERQRLWVRLYIPFSSVPYASHACFKKSSILHKYTDVTKLGSISFVFFSKRQCESSSRIVFLPCQFWNSFRGTVWEGWMRHSHWAKELWTLHLQR